LKVLVTGANGFIGSHVVESLTRDEIEVIALCEYNFSSSIGWLDSSKYSSRIQTELGDIRDLDFLRRICKQVDCIIHLAALISIPYSYESPRSNIEVNLMGTLNILEVARDLGIKIIHTSTSEVYGTPKTVPIREDHTINPQSPYAASKVAADYLVQSFTRSFDVPTLTIRPFNTYGPRQSARAVIPTILSQAIHNDEIKLGNIDSERDFTYISDTVKAFSKALIKGNLFNGSVIHLGYGESISIKNLVAKIARIIDKPLYITESDERVRPIKSEVEILRSDPSLALDRLDWRAEISLSEGIDFTWRWMLENVSKYPRYLDYLK
jgi:nucleoside-diphosphate-sugar epimerase